MSPSQLADQLRAKIDDLKRNNRPLKLATASAVAEMSERIFTRGENVAGQTFQYNSTNPIYVDPKDSPKKFPTKGKNGKTTFANGESHKTGYFDSYKSYKKAIGQKTDHVHFALHNDLKFDFENTRSEGDKPSAIRMSVNEYQVKLERPLNAEVAEGLEAGTNKKVGYGPIFRMSQKEITMYYDILEKELALMFSP